MSGMNTNLNPTNLSDYQGRIALIKLKGVFPGNGMGKSADTIKVPFSRLSQTLQKIRNAGVPVENITFTSWNHQSIVGISTAESRVIDTPNSTASSPIRKDTKDNQQLHIPEIDSDEYLANIGGEVKTIELLPGLGVKFTKTIQNLQAKT